MKVGPYKELDIVIKKIRGKYLLTVIIILIRVLHFLFTSMIFREIPRCLDRQTKKME